MNKLIMLSFALIVLSGCASRPFDVPPEKGLTGMSVSDVDKYTKRGRKTTTKNTIEKEVDLSIPKTDFVVQNYSNQPSRVGEHVLQMWIAPYESEDGIYFQQSYINVVVKKGEWLPPVVDDLSEMS